MTELPIHCECCGWIGLLNKCLSHYVMYDLIPEMMACGKMGTEWLCPRCGHIVETKYVGDKVKA